MKIECKGKVTEVELVETETPRGFRVYGKRESRVTMNTDRGSFTFRLTDAEAGQLLESDCTTHYNVTVTITPSAPDPVAAEIDELRKALHQAQVRIEKLDSERRKEKRK